MLQANSVTSKRLQLDNRDPNNLKIIKVRIAFLVEAISVAFGIASFYLITTTTFQRFDTIEQHFKLFFVIIGAIAFYFGLSKIDKGIKIFRNGEIIQFDKINDLILVNSVKIDRLSEIKVVENQLISDSDGVSSSLLKILLNSGRILEIDQSNSIDENEWIGRTIAKFVNREFEIRENGLTESEQIKQVKRDHENLVQTFENKFQNKSTKELDNIISKPEYADYAKEAALRLKSMKSK